MTSQDQIDNIATYFVNTTDEMLKISTASDPPTFTSLQDFQDAINANAMAVPAPAKISVMPHLLWRCHIYLEQMVVPTRTQQVPELHQQILTLS